MKFDFSKQRLAGREAFLQRFFEILPGAASWTILGGMILLSFWKPLFAAAIIIAFDFYWLLRLFYMTFFLVMAYLRLSIEKETDWMARVKGLDDSARKKGTGRELLPVPFFESAKRKISDWIFRKEFKALERADSKLPRSSDIYHLILLPIAREAPEVVEPGIISFLHQKFPAKQVLVVLAVEERASGHILYGAQELQRKYRDSFLDFLVVVHPDDIPGEARVKGANITYAAKEAARYFREQEIPFENVVASCFDADTVVSPSYFPCLTYHFMICPSRLRASFQPIPVYHNNIWEAPGFARVLDIGSSFFQLIEVTNPDKLVTFSSHSMSFKALVDVGYWPVDMISDDSAIFWKALIHFDGDYRVIPMYVTLSMDVVSTGPWWKSIAAVYKQKRRWACGVENFPIVMRAFLKANQIALSQKLRYGFKLFENHVAWATWAFLLTVIGWLPALFAGREFSNSVLYYSAPRITSIIFNLASLSLVITMILSFLLLPKRRIRHPFLKRIELLAEWFLVPFIVTFLSALPALDAQTRLMFGKYMEFWVTEKSRGNGVNTPSPLRGGR